MQIVRSLVDMYSLSDLPFPLMLYCWLMRKSEGVLFPSFHLHPVVQMADGSDK